MENHIGKILSLPFKVKSIVVMNTGLEDEDVEGIVWIDQKRLEITNPVRCVVDNGCGGTSAYCVYEYYWSFTKRTDWSNAYVLITLEE